ncbi:hypothetical protein GCM10007962_28850 [Yeosuana aromativorans]|uniref:Uncharacterized protein n=1 Tax=Yeosuana aromativorans TaxID=288019 RepID=A0A8J3FL81_9FLAO|nr:hypothetical protein GCM10007962_28850 [Yeosuana aromativorans]
MDPLQKGENDQDDKDPVIATGIGNHGKVQEQNKAKNGRKPVPKDLEPKTELLPKGNR